MACFSSSVGLRRWSRPLKMASGSRLQWTALHTSISWCSTAGRRRGRRDPPSARSTRPSARASAPRTASAPPRWRAGAVGCWREQLPHLVNFDVMNPQRLALQNTQLIHNASGEAPPLLPRLQLGGRVAGRRGHGPLQGQLHRSGILLPGVCGTNDRAVSSAEWLGQTHFFS